MKDRGFFLSQLIGNNHSKEVKQGECLTENLWTQASFGFHRYSSNQKEWKKNGLHKNVY